MLCLTNVVHLTNQGVGYIFLVLAIIFFVVWAFFRCFAPRRPFVDGLDPVSAAAAMPPGADVPPMGGVGEAPYGGPIPHAAPMAPPMGAPMGPPPSQAYGNPTVPPMARPAAPPMGGYGPVYV